MRQRQRVGHRDDHLAEPIPTGVHDDRRMLIPFHVLCVFYVFIERHENVVVHRFFHDREQGVQIIIHGAAGDDHIRPFAGHDLRADTGERRLAGGAVFRGRQDFHFNIGRAAHHADGINKALHDLFHSLIHAICLTGIYKDAQWLRFFFCAAGEQANNHQNGQ